MKNDKIITAWDKVEPDEAAKERMLSGILAENSAFAEDSSKRKMNSGKKKTLIIAASLAAAAGIAVVLGLSFGWFGSRNYMVTLANGDKVTYTSNEWSFGSYSLSFDCPTTPRELTEEEKKLIFPEGVIPDSAYAEFQSDTGKLLHLPYSESRVMKVDLVNPYMHEENNHFDLLLPPGWTDDMWNKLYAFLTKW